MTYEQALKSYRALVRETNTFRKRKKERALDKVAVRVGWCEYIDYLARDRMVEEKSARNWDNPFP